MKEYRCLYEKLRSFIQMVSAEGVEPPVLEALYQLLLETMDLRGDADVAYLLVDNIADESDRYEVVDSHALTDYTPEKQLFVRELINSLLYKPESEIFTGEQLSQLHGGPKPVSVYALPLVDRNMAVGYALFLHRSRVFQPLDPERLRFARSLLDVVAICKQRQFYEGRMEYLSLNDNLTNMPNRTFFYEALVASVQESTIMDTSFVLLMININGLKQINNSLGPFIGDLLLSEFANRLKISLKDQHAITGRMSGDDFAMLVNLPERTEAGIRAYGNAILEQTRDPIRIEDYALYITLNIGASVFPDHGDTVETLVKRADEAKASAKRQGNNSFVIYEDVMSAATQKTLFLNNNLPLAIENDQFELFFQGQVDMQTCAIIGAEALIRWRHPERGIIPPFEFIPYAEENNYAITIDEIVLRKACAQMRDWKAQGFDISISVNISAKHFQNGLILNTLGHVFSEYPGIDAHKLKVELLESTVLDDFNMTVMVIRELRKMGVAVALDDFGAGYSSLEYVTSLPLDIIKIDKSFTMNLYDNPNNKIILNTVVSLAQNMDLQVLAEGVENKAQWDYLHSIGCDIAQGYLINKPLPASEFVAFAQNFTEENLLH